MDCNPPNASVCGILQARILEWVAFLSPGDLPDPGIKLVSLTWQMESYPEPPGKPYVLDSVIYFNLTKSTGSKLHVEVGD